MSLKLGQRKGKNIPNADTTFQQTKKVAVVNLPKMGKAQETTSAAKPFLIDGDGYQEHPY